MVPYAYMMQGFRFEREGRFEAAQAIWREGLRRLRPELPQLRATTSPLVNAMILGSLTGELTDDEARDFIRKTATASGGLRRWKSCKE